MDSRLNVLLVDDDEMDAELVRESLYQADPTHSFTIASDGEEALILLRSAPLPHPLLILLDLKMPIVDGVTFLKELRQDPTLKHFVVFIVTGSEDDVNTLNTYNLGIAGFLAKNKFGRQYEELATFLVAYNKVVDYPRLS